MECNTMSGKGESQIGEKNRHKSGNKEGIKNDIAIDCSKRHSSIWEYFVSLEAPVKDVDIFGYKMDLFPTFFDFVLPRSMQIHFLLNMKGFVHGAHVEKSLPWACLQFVRTKFSEMLLSWYQIEMYKYLILINILTLWIQFLFTCFFIRR